MKEKYIVFTGVTSGIGLALIKGFSERYSSSCKLHLCVTCRNLTKGRSLKMQLEDQNTNVIVTLVKMDMNNIHSILNAADVIKEIYPQINCMYLNAGIMPVSSVNWGNILRNLLNPHLFHMFKTGEGILNVYNECNEEGLNSIFTTNVLGHHVLIKELMPKLSPSDEKSSSRIIWTTSMSSTEKAFDPNDLTGMKGSMPYESSKYVLEASSIALNNKYNASGIYSLVGDPGTAVTNILTSILPSWVWTLFVIPLFCLLRIIIPSNNLSPERASESLIQLFDIKPSSLSSNKKLCSRTTVFNKTYTKAENMCVIKNSENDILQQITELADEVTSRYR